MRQARLTKDFHVRLTPELFAKMERFALAQGYSGVAELVRQIMNDVITIDELQREDGNPTST